MEYTELPHEDLPQPYVPAWDELQAATAEAPFMEASFYLLKEALHWMMVISALRPPTSLDRNRAIIRGMIVRTTKLLRLTMRELNSRETFQQLSVTRDAVETLATLVYLLGDDGTGERFDKYVLNGLVAEREFLRDVQGNISRRDGKVWPIEERMQRSIATMAKAAGIEDVSAIPGRRAIGFPNVEERVKLLGPNAYITYRMGSVETHGDWTDLLRNHLEYENGVFSPNLSSAEVRPQNPLMLTILTISVVVDNLNRIVEDVAIASSIKSQLEELVARASRADELHESFLQAAQAKRATA
ncbi:DUF5677 domain-containing protein [Actinomadura sp. 3N508]|uniref:DUF5677 domain-containing protein n=1 Tax=Actinomadura sp. 3N508 TaxID=3375153 RepID=UPI0037B50A45